MNKVFLIIALVLLSGCGKREPRVDIWTAAGTGDLELFQQHVAVGADLNAREPDRGSTPLMAAALLGQAEAVRLLVEKGAKLDPKNYDGATALHIAAFFCHPETTALLVELGADLDARNLSNEKPIDIVSGDWTPALEKVYVTLASSV